MTLRLGSSTTTPLTPPKLEEDRSSWLRLYRSRGVGVHTFFRLMREHGDAAVVLALLPDLAAKAGVRDYAAASLDETRAEWRAAKRFGARLVCYGDAEYPALLATIDDPPPLFWAMGDLALLSRPAVALVGARNASALGCGWRGSLRRSLAARGSSPSRGWPAASTPPRTRRA